jgi:hypothetical protein
MLKDDLGRFEMRSKIHDEIRAKIDKRLGHPSKIFYGVFEEVKSEEYGWIPSDNLSSLIAEGRVILRMGETLSSVLKSPTYLDAAVFVDEVYAKSTDGYHVFDEVNKTDEKIDGVRVFDIDMDW